MPVNARIVGRDGDTTDVISRINGVGSIVYAGDLVVTEPSTRFFSNPDFGINMNLDAGFTGTPELIHNGINTTEYTGSSIQGSKFTFNSTAFGVQSNITIVDYAVIDNGDTITINSDGFEQDATPILNQWLAETSNTVTATNLATAINDAPGLGYTASSDGAVVTVSEDTGVGITTFTENAGDEELTLVTTASGLTDNASLNDIMQFAKGSDLTLANFTAVTLRIYVDSDWEAGDSLTFCGYDTGLGVIVGNTVNLEEYFDFGNFDTWHALVIPLVDLGIETSTTVDAFRISIAAKTGAKSPKAYFDRIQLEAAGGSETFRMAIAENERFHIQELIFSYADVFDSTLLNGTVTGIGYDEILGLSALTNGFTIVRSKAGVTVFSITISTIGDQVSAGAELTNQMDDGNTMFVTLKAMFDRPLILTGDVEDILTITINDNMSGLLQFRVAARGGLETL